MTRTFEEVRFEINIEEVTAETLDGVVEWKDVHSFTVLDIEALVNVDEITELDSEVVSGNLVYLDLALFNGIVAQTDENSVSPLLATMFIELFRELPHKVEFIRTYRTMIVSPRKRPRTSIVAGLRVATRDRRVSS